MLNESNRIASQSERLFDRDKLSDELTQKIEEGTLPESVNEKLKELKAELSIINNPSAEELDEKKKSFKTILETKNNYPAPLDTLFINKVRNNPQLVALMRFLYFKLMCHPAENAPCSKRIFTKLSLAKRNIFPDTMFPDVLFPDVDGFR